jgi:hypothetical protein
MPEEDPDAVGDAAEHNPPAGSLETGVFPLRGQRLEDGVGNQANVNQPPDRKDIARGDEIDFKLVGDLACVLAVEGQGIGQGVDDQGYHHRDDYSDLSNDIFHNFTTLNLVDFLIFGPDLDFLRSDLQIC